MPFQKGVSGNPGGRPKKDPAIEEIFKAAAPEAAAELIRLSKEAENNADRIKACAVILDRALGKPIAQAQLQHGPVEIRWMG